MMSRHNKLMRLTAFLLSFLLLLPIMPVFAEPLAPLDMDEEHEYKIEITGPSKAFIPFFNERNVTYTAVVSVRHRDQVEPSDDGWSDWQVVPNPIIVWKPGVVLPPSNLGLTMNKNTVTIPANADEGQYNVIAYFYDSIDEFGMPKAQDYMTTTIEKQIPVVSFVNGDEDFDLDIPTHDGEVNINYTAVILNQDMEEITELTAKVRMLAASSNEVGAYYDQTENRLELRGRPGYAGTIDVEAYIEEFDDLENTELSKAVPTPIPVYSVEKTITISRDEDMPNYGILIGKERIDIPRTGALKEVYTYKIFSQYDVELEDIGNLADFYFPGYQPATFKVDKEAQTLEITVKNTAPHSYLMFRVRLYNEEMLNDTSDEPEAPALKEMWFGWKRGSQIYIYLDKTVYGTMDDANNLVLLDNPVAPTDDGPTDPEEPIEQAIYENLQYRVAAFYPDPEPEAVASAVRDGSWSEGWRDYNPEDPPKFPGKMDVEFRYKNNYRWRPMIEVDMDIECRPKAYAPGEVTEYNFTVLKPSIAANPTSPLVGSSSSVTITYNELHPGFELVPADIEDDLYWYDSNHFPYIALKSMWYRIGETGEWQRYENPFTVTASTIIFAKTVVFLDLVLDQLRGTTDLPQYFDYSGNYTSPLASIAINFQQPTTQAPTQPETQAPTQPETQGPTQPETTQTLAPVETTTVSVAPATVAIEEVTVPQGALEETTTVQASASDLVFYEVVTPLGDATLPETNELPISLLYGMGVILGGLGVYLVKRKED